MSNINKVKIINPYGETDDALMLHLDSLDDGYHLSDLIDYCSNYTFSIWHKADSDNIIQFNIFGETHEINSTKTWQKFIHTTTVSSLDNIEISIYSHTNTNFYLYEAFLCEGDIDLSWSPAPEDFDERFAKIEIEKDKITSAVFDAETGESKITQTATQLTTEINSKTSGKAIIESINADTGEYTIKAEKIKLEGAVITDEFYAENIHISGNSTFDGIIKAKAGGTIGGFEIGERDLHNITENGSIYVGIDGIRSNFVNEDDAYSRSYLLKDGVSEYGSVDDGMYYRVDCSGSELILSSDTYIRNEIAERLEPFYRTGEMSFLKTIKYPDSDAEIELIGGIDYKGLYIGGEYGVMPDPILGDETGRKYILTWNNGSLSPEDDVYLLNGKAIRGARTGSGNNVIGYISNENRTVLGHHEDNSAATEVRSPVGIYLKCNGNKDDDNNECGIKFFYANNAVWFRPCKDNTTNLGGTNYYWSNIYVKNNPIDLSDINHKRDITEIDDRYIKLFDLIEPYAYHFIDGDRVHTGFISQYVEDAMLQVGLTAEELGFFCKDIKTKTVESDNGELIEVPEYDENGNLQYIYALRYEEYIAIVTKKVKQLENKIDSQQEQINKLLEMIQAQQKTLDALVK